jgi:pimeloyl-ACP methyl ester carboxylesterase
MTVTLTHIEHPASGDETQPPLLIAHGLFGSARNFNMLARRLATCRRVVAVDMRNHGLSPWDPVNTYPAMAEDLADAIDRLCGGRASVLGHSMGGKAVMTLALTYPELLSAVMVADIAPVQHVTHSHWPYIRAMQALDLGQITRRSDADRMLADAIPDDTLRSFLVQNLSVEGGRVRWRINLPALEANMETLIDFPTDLPEEAFDGPAYFLYGARSPYVPPETHPRIRAYFPFADIEPLPDAGHWLHAEHPEAFLTRIGGWLQQAAPA